MLNSWSAIPLLRRWGFLRIVPGVAPTESNAGETIADAIRECMGIGIQLGSLLSAKPWIGCGMVWPQCMKNRDERCSGVRARPAMATFKSVSIVHRTHSLI